MKKRTVQVAAIALAGVSSVAGLATLGVAEYNHQEINNSICYECNGSDEFSKIYQQDLENLQYQLNNETISAKEYVDVRQYLESDEYKEDVYFNLTDVNPAVQQELANQLNFNETLENIAAGATAGMVSVAMATAMAANVYESYKNCENPYVGSTTIEHEFDDRIKRRKNELQSIEEITK